PSTVISTVPAATASPSQVWAVSLTSGSSLRNAASTSGRPLITPASRAATTARPMTPDGTVATDVTSPARPKSSASARATASSMANGERKASGHVVFVIAATGGLICGTNQ